MGTLVCKSSVGLKLGRVRDALISPERPLARGGAARPTGSSTTTIKNSAADQHYRSNDYAFGLKKPRRTQMTQRPNSSSARGTVPACPARCLRWSPNVQMPAPSGTRIGAVSSAIRGAEVFFQSLLTVSLPSTVAAESYEYPHGVRLHQRHSSRSRARCLVGGVSRTKVPGARALLCKSGLGLKL
jgi:hypothetical protein